MFHHRKREIMSRIRIIPTTRVAAAATLLAAGLIVVPALATPGSGITVTALSKGDFEELDVKADKADNWDLLLKTKDDSDIGVDHLVIAPGGRSGWHTHAGSTLVTVTVGEVEWYDGDDSLCPSRTYRAGEGFVEPANHVHNVRNTSGAPAEIVAVQMRPDNTPGRIDAPKPDDCPSF